MRTSDVLKRTPGLTRAQLTWYERAGYVSPILVEKSKQVRRVYTNADLQLIQAIYSYRSRGYRPREAYKHALRDLAREPDTMARPPPLAQQLAVVYEAHQQEIDSLLQEVFGGAELSLEQICYELALLLTAPEHRRKFRGLIAVLPIEEVSQNHYRYNRNPKASRH